MEVLAEEGQEVEAGQVLFRLDGSLLEAQRAQAETALASAQAGVEVAQHGPAGRARRHWTLAGTVRPGDWRPRDLQEQPQRTSAWSANQPTEFELPAWYFTRAEETGSRRTSEVRAAAEDLEAGEVQLC